MTHARSLSFRFGLLAATLSLSGPALAGGGKTVRIRSFDDFDSGEVEGAAIESSGRLSVGFVSARTTAPGSAVLSCLGEGDRALIGTAQPATIQRAGVRGKKGELSLEKIAELPGVAVTALARIPGGDLVAASLPGGTLHRIDGRGKVHELVRLDVQHVWALLPHRGRLLAATGGRGEVWSIGFDGKNPKIVLDVDESDVLALHAVGDAVLAGTSPRAKLYQVTDRPEGLLIHEFRGDEVKAIATLARGVAVAVNDFADRSMGTLDALTKKLERASVAGAPVGSGLTEVTSPVAEGWVYVVDLGPRRDLARASDSPWEQWFRRDKQYFTGMLALEPSGGLLLSSAGEGKVYRVRDRRDHSTVADFDEREATGVCGLANGMVLATTGDGAAIHRLQAAVAKSARFRSEVYDATQPATFGTVRVRGRGPLALRARSGPSKKPDDKRWGRWHDVTLRASAGELEGSLRELAKRRYVQLELVLRGEDAEVRGVELAYAPENLAPVLRDVTIKPPSFRGDDDRDPEPSATILWNADAQDEDELIYQVRVRPEGGGTDTWIELHGDAPVDKRELKWDLSTVPDGVYEVEVRASDEPANGSARARTDEMTSEPFVVDHTRPGIQGAAVNAGVVTGTAIDSASTIHSIYYALDGGPFRAASPSDGLFDERSERFELRLPPELEAGNHRLVLRARDATGNTAVVALVVRR